MKTKCDLSNGSGLREYACDAHARLRSSQPIHSGPVGTGRMQNLQEFRVDLHMRMVHRALDQIRELNPKGTVREDLSEEVWDSLARRRERSLLDIVDAEVRFWASTISNNPMIRLGKLEAAWVDRVVRLAVIIRKIEDYRREELAFLQDRAS